MKKKIWSLFIALMAVMAVVFAFAACDKDDDDKGAATKYTVTYVAGEGAQGTAPAGGEYAEGDTFTLPAATGLSKEDYDFDKWNDGTADYAVGATYTMPAKNVTFTAKWKESDGGDGPVPITPPSDDDLIYMAVDTGESVYLLLYDGGIAALNGTDASDKEWTEYFYYTVSGETIEITISGVKYSGTYTYSATYEMNVVNITLTHKGHTYEFKVENTTPIPSGAPTIHFTANGGTGSAPTCTPEYNSTSGMYKITLPANTYTAPAGKVFDKWQIVNGKNTDKRAAGTSYMANAGEELTISPIWKDDTLTPPEVVTGTTFTGECTVSVKFNDLMTFTETYTKFIVDFVNLKVTYYFGTDKYNTITLSDNSTMKPDSAGADDYYYEGRFESNLALCLLIKADKSQLVLHGANNNMPFQNGTFTASGSIGPLPSDTYTVTFNPNNESATWTETVNAGATVSKPATDPTISNGKAFRYWRDDETGNEYNFNSPVNANLDLTAIYAWKVTFEAGEGTGTVAPAWVNVWTAAGVDLPNGTGLTHTSKVFGGWTDGSETYAAGERFMGTGNHTLTAVWNAAPTYTVTYVKPAGVTGDMPANETVNQGGKVTLPACPVTKAGYVFCGWKIDGATQLRAANTQYTVNKNISVTPIFGITVNGAYDAMTVRDDNVVNMDGDLYDCTRNGNVVTLTEWGFSIELDEATKTYIILDGMYGYSFTAQNGETLSFDGKGGATLGTHSGEYELTNNGGVFSLALTIGGSTHNVDLEVKDYAFVLKTTITVDGTDYVFGSSGGENPPSGEWVAITDAELQTLCDNETKLYFEDVYNYSTTIFLGVKFTKNSLGNGIKTLYVSNNGEAEPGSVINLDTTSTTENGNWLTFKNTTYTIILGKKSDGNFYVVSFKYKSTGTVDTTERALTGTTAPSWQ